MNLHIRNGKCGQVIPATGDGFIGEGDGLVVGHKITDYRKIRENIDQHGAGTAQFICEAITVFFKQ